MTAKSTALVTGASGFIGRVLSQTLVEEGERVSGLMRTPQLGPWHRLIKLDLSVEVIPNNALEGIDTVFHLAGRAHAIAERQPQEELYHRVNAKGTQNLIEASIRNGVKRFVLFSSVKAMGDGTVNCQDESAMCSPSSAYGRSKLDAERLVLKAGKESDLHVVVLRLPLVYGPGVKGNLASMLAAIASNRFPPLKITENKRSMIHVADVARAARAVIATETSVGQIYIITDGVAYSTTTIYKLMCAALNKSPPRWHVPLWILRAMARFGDTYGFVSGRRFPIDSHTLCRLTESAWYSSEKIREQLGFRTMHRFEKSVKEMS